MTVATVVTGGSSDSGYRWLRAVVTAEVRVAVVTAVTVVTSGSNDYSGQ